MHKIPIEENFDNQNHFMVDKDKDDLFLKDLNYELNLLSNKDNIGDLYHNFMTTLFTFIKKFSLKVSCKKENRMVNPSYEKKCKIAIKSIRDATNEFLKSNKINMCKALIKRKKHVLYK
jgi:hypothetical protein